MRKHANMPRERSGHMTYECLGTCLQGPGNASGAARGTRDAGNLEGCSKDGPDLDIIRDLELMSHAVAREKVMINVYACSHLQLWGCVACIW